MRWSAALVLAAGCLGAPPHARDGGVPDAGEEPGANLWQVPLQASLPYVAVSGGTAVVAAGFSGTVDLDPPITAEGGGTDLLIAGLDAGGRVQFARAYGGPGDELPTAVTVSPVSGAVAVVGLYGAAEANVGGGPLQEPAGGLNLFAARYDETGEHVWSLAGSATGGLAPLHAVSLGGAGDVALTGDYGADLRVGDGFLSYAGEGRELFFSRVTASGGTAVLLGYGGIADQVGAAAIDDGLGSLYLVGTQTGPFELDEFSPDADADGDMFVAQIDQTGADATWLVDTVGGRVGGLRAVAAPDGALLLAGWFEGNFAFDMAQPVELSSRGGSDAFIAMIEPGGGLRWLKQFGGQGDDEPLGVAVARDGRFAVAGAFHGTAQLGGDELASAGGSDIFLLAFDADGALRWARRFGDGADDQGVSVAVDDDGAVLLGAIFRGVVDFGGAEPLDSGGAEAGAVIRFR